MITISIQGWNWTELGKVDTIRAKLALSKGGIGPNWAKWTLSGQGWHYPRAVLGSIEVKWPLSGQSWHYPTVELGQIGQSGHCLGQGGTIPGWIGAKSGPSWHYPRVDRGQKWPILVTVDEFEGWTARPVDPIQEPMRRNGEASGMRFPIETFR